MYQCGVVQGLYQIELAIIATAAGTTDKGNAITILLNTDSVSGQCHNLSHYLLVMRLKDNPLVEAAHLLAFQFVEQHPTSVMYFFVRRIAFDLKWRQHTSSYDHHYANNDDKTYDKTKGVFERHYISFDKTSGQYLLADTYPLVTKFVLI